MNLRCMTCQSVFREADAIGDLHCPECYGTQLWETTAKTDDQLAKTDADANSAELEAVARRRIEARGIADELVDVLRDVMGGVR